jgi:hypothetical protein
VTTPAGLAALLVLIASARIVSTYGVLSATFDEPAHLGSGMQWLEGHQYTYNDVHPPLARIAGAIGLHFAGLHWSEERYAYPEGIHLLGSGAHYWRALSAARSAMLPFFWLACAVVYVWAFDLGGPVAAVFATLLFTALPPVLAHAGLVTNDMALTGCMGLTILLSLRWYRDPAWKWTALFGMALGLAVLAKFTALVFLPSVWMAMWVVNRTSRGPRVRVSWPRAACVAGLAFVVIWAGYLFTFGKVEYLHNRLPAPEFFRELGELFDYNQGSHAAYLLGKVSLQGFWYYYPVVLSIKTPIALLLLTAIAAAAAWRREDPWKVRMPLAMAAGILLFSMLFVRLNIGVRHVLPVYLGFTVAAGLVCARLIEMRLQWVVGFLMAAYVISGAWQHPEYLSYTNEFAGKHPENLVADSDLDWGQDMARLAARLNSLGVKKVWINCDPGYVMTGNPFPETQSIPEGENPPPGWTVVCVTPWKLDSRPPWPARVPPAERIGRSIFLYGPTAPR